MNRQTIFLMILAVVLGAEDVWAECRSYVQDPCVGGEALAVTSASGCASRLAAASPGPKASRTCHVLTPLQADGDEPEFEGKSASAWIEVLKEPDGPLAGPATRALGRLGRRSEAVVQMLVELLDDEDRIVCMKAAYALAEIGPKAKPAVPALLDAIRKHQIPFVVTTLTRINPDPNAVVPSLTTMLDDENRQVRSEAVARLFSQLIESKDEAFSNCDTRFVTSAPRQKLPPLHSFARCVRKSRRRTWKGNISSEKAARESPLFAASTGENRPGSGACLDRGISR